MTLQTHPTAPRPKRKLMYAGKPHSEAYIRADLEACGLSYSDMRVFITALIWGDLIGANRKGES